MCEFRISNKAFERPARTTSGILSLAISMLVSTVLAVVLFAPVGFDQVAIAQAPPSQPTALSVEAIVEDEAAARFREYLEQGGSLELVFEPIAEAARASRVRVVGPWNVTTGFGTVVHEDGWILTKASSLIPERTPRCELPDGSTHDAEIYGIDDAHDLALLRVPVPCPVEAKFAKDKSFALGQYLVSIGPRSRLEIGTTSVLPRPGRGFLGVRLQEGGSEGIRIVTVVADTAASRAGLRAGDRIRTIEGRTPRTVDHCTRLISDHAPGTEVAIGIVRNGEATTIAVRLGGRVEPEGAEDFGEGELSRVRSGIANVLQHDARVEPEYIGGPVVDSTGEIVAINIARAGRTRTLAIPIDRALEVFERLRRKESGV